VTCDDKEAVLPLKMFANGVSGIIFQQENGRSALSRECATSPTRSDSLPNLFVYGKRTQPGRLVARGSFELTGVVFRPHAVNVLLSIDARDTNNGPIELAEFSRENVADRLLNVSSRRERLRVLVAFLRGRVDRAKSADALVSEALRMIHEGVRSTRVQHLLSSLEISERQFERRFLRVVGVSPHQYIRIARFQEALRLIKVGQFETWSKLAYDLNYSDQSHFIKNVNAFSGFTPTVLLETVRRSVDLPCALIVPPQDTGIPAIRIPDGPDAGFLQSFRSRDT
jgi:AraC-like DNA-binding protein